MFLTKKRSEADTQRRDTRNKYCKRIIRTYYRSGSGSFSETKAVESALKKIESKNDFSRDDYDMIFSYFYENGRRNANAAAMECFVSASNIYKRLSVFCGAVQNELEEMKKYAFVTVLRG